MRYLGQPLVDYCLGRGSYNVAEGAIRKKVAWFGIHLSKGEDQVFIARDNPGPGAATGSKVYFQRGVQEPYPALEVLVKNNTESSLKNFVTKFAGISENEHRPYYPPDSIEGGLDQIEKDADRKAVESLFELMKTACDEIEPNFQLIVLDHAHLRDKWFEDSIVQEWRGDEALVPYDWPDAPSGTGN